MAGCVPMGSYLWGKWLGILASTRLLIQSVPGGNVNVLGGHSIGHSKQKK